MEGDVLASVLASIGGVTALGLAALRFAWVVYNKMGDKIDRVEGTMRDKIDSMKDQLSDLTVQTAKFETRFERDQP